METAVRESTSARATKGGEKVAEVRDLHKSFGDRKVLDGVNLDLYAGENLVILGRSGTGMSVLIKCMVGLLRPDAGQIRVLGYSVPELNNRELNELGVPDKAKPRNLRPRQAKGHGHPCS